MGISVGHIIEALSLLGGEAHLKDIEQMVVKIAPLPHPKEPQASIRARIQERCAETASYLQRENLFESVYGVQEKKGFWRLRADPLNPSSPYGFQDGAEAFVEAEEGRVNLKIHLRRERSKKLIDAFKAKLTEPRCEACGMSFAEVYGDLGGDYIEAHHKIPIAQLDRSSTTTLDDLAAVCANCHRMINKNNLMLVKELAEFLMLRKK